MLVTALVLLMTTLVLAGTFHYYTHMDDPENKFVFRQGAGDDDEGGDASAMQWVYRLKAQGILDDPNDFAQALLVTIALSTMLWGHSLAANLLLVLVPGSVLMFGIYLTHSRGALVALVVMAMVALRRRLKILGTAAAGLIIGCGLIYIRFTGARQISVSSGVDRLDLWSEGLYLFKHSYGLGIGLHNFADNVGKTAHNSFLLVATETGLVGLALFLAIFVVCFTQLMRIVKPVDGSAQDAVLAHEARSLEAALAAYLASSWFLSRAYGPVPYLLVGLVATVAFQAAERAPDTPLLPRWPVLVRNTLILTPACLGAIYAMVRLRGL